MITKAQVVPLLLTACPTAAPKWEEHLAWLNGEERGGFLDVAVFAQHIVDSYANGVTNECGPLFAAVEQIIETGDEDARGLAVTGVLEDIQTISIHHPFGPAAFEHWLGPKSRQAWLEIEALWQAGGASLAGVIRYERALATPRKWWQFWKRS